MSEGSQQLVSEGMRLRRAGDLQAAEEVLRTATKLYPLSAAAWAERGEVMVHARRPAEAVEYLSRAAELSRPSGQTLFSLAWACLETKDYEQAKAYLRRTLKVDPSIKASAALLSADIAFRQEDWTAAAAEAARCLETAPDTVYALVLHARACEKLARIEEAVSSARRCLAIERHLAMHHWLTFQINLVPETTPESLFEECRRWNAFYAEPLKSEFRPHTNTADSDRRLKVGYLSPDLYTHALFKSIAPVFEHHDHARFEIFVYSLGNHSDLATDKIRGDIANFVTLPASRNDIAERVRQDGIDILVDLAGHSMPDADAYLAFAMKPAPVQVSWLGVLATTGLSTMDYFIGGPDFPFRGTEQLFSEKVFRLPRISCCYRPMATVAVADRPCARNGFITFGSFNNPRKITRNVVKLWSVILHFVPESRIFFKYKDLEKPEIQERLRAWFLEDAIAPERLTFEGASGLVEYMNSWGKVDIALDSFPYTGGTTTLDALWAGVPVVTLNGRMPVQSSGASLLGAAGLPFAETPEQYVSTALFLAENAPKDPEMRTRVREAIASSPLMDEVGLVRAIEAAFINMWRAWCERAK